MMPLADPNDAFDRQAHASYREATDALSPTMQGRLRAARRTALAGATARPASSRRLARQAMPIAAVAMALFAVAIGLRWQPGGNDGSIPASPQVAQATADPADAKAGHPQADPRDPAAEATTAIHATGAPQAAEPALAALSADADSSLLMLEEDPEVYLWLGSDDASAADTEQDHDPT